MLSEQSIIDQITVLENGQIMVRRADRVWRDEVLAGETFHRHVLFPGQDLRGEDARVAAIAGVVHTPAVIAAYQSAQE